MARDLCAEGGGRLLELDGHDLTSGSFYPVMLVTGMDAVEANTLRISRIWTRHGAQAIGTTNQLDPDLVWVRFTLPSS
ncbi:hypothetical protein JCM8547_007548 [Rhodosporidiobolus lusitaniae]